MTSEDIKHQFNNIISFTCMWPGVGASLTGCIHMCIVHTFSEGWSLHKNPFRLCRSQAWTRSRSKITCFIMLRALSQVALSAAGHGYSPSLLLLLCSVVWGRGEQGGWKIKFSSLFLKSAFMFRISEEDIQVEWESPTPADITPRVVAAPHQSPAAFSEKNESRSAGGRERAGVSDPVVQAGWGAVRTVNTALGPVFRRGLVPLGHTALTPVNTHAWGLTHTA